MMVAQTALAVDGSAVMGRRRTSDPKLNKAFGMQLRALLEQRLAEDPLLLEKMAVATGIQGTTLNTYRYGTREPGFFTAAKISLFLGVRMEELIPPDLLASIRPR